MNATSSYPGRAAPDTEFLEWKLTGLVDSGFLETVSPNKYSFGNKLTWEVIYDSVMFSEKRRLHDQVAEYIERNSNGSLENAADLLLHHYESANNYHKTVFYAALAGDRSARMFAREEAIHSYGRALNALAQMGDTRTIDKSLVLEKCGDVYRNSGDYREAIENYLAAFNSWEISEHDHKPESVPWSVNQASRNSNLCRKISVSYEYASKYDEASSWIDKAVQFLPENSITTAPSVYTAKSAIHFRKGEYEEAIDWGERALAIARGSGNSGDMAYAHNIIANTFIHVGKLHEAIRHLKQAVILYDEEQDFMGMASANSNLGSCYLLSDKLEYAIRHYQVALEVEEKIQNDARVAIDHNNLGEVYLMQGQLEKSVALFEKVIIAHRKGYAPAALAGYALMNISRCKVYEGALEDARESIGKALELIRDSGVKVIFLEAQLQHATILLAEGQLEDARSLCENARKEIKAQGAKLLEVRADRVLAKILSRLGMLEPAIEDINRSIGQAKNMGSKFEEARSLKEHARIMLEHLGDKVKALESLERAESIFSDIGAARELYHTGSLKARLASPA